jgi:hypothetical protein
MSLKAEYDGAMGRRRNAIKLMAAIVLGGICLLAAVISGLAEEDCGRCKQIHVYACAQDRSSCTEACGGVTVTDRDGCRQRCRAAFGQCSRHAQDKCGSCPAQPFNFQAPPLPPR